MVWVAGLVRLWGGVRWVMYSGGWGVGGVGGCGMCPSVEGLGCSLRGRVRVVSCGGGCCSGGLLPVVVAVTLRERQYRKRYGV